LFAISVAIATVNGDKPKGRAFVFRNVDSIVDRC
jgi:hypothetical protein